MDIPWKIEMLGSLRVTRGDRTVTAFRSRKVALLLCYLSLYPRSHPRELLIELLWPECAPAAGRRNLRVELTWLRHQLEPPGVPTGAVVVADSMSVGLNAGAMMTDVTAFKGALRVARQSGDDAERVQRLGEAVALYGGELLPGYYEDWILSERQHLAEQCFQALGQLVAHLEREGDHHQALLAAQRGVTLDPLREEAQHDLIRLYVATGQTTAARRQYGELERRLKDELGTTPSASTRALVLEIELREARPGNLPAQRSPIIGRATEAAAVEELLRRESVGLLTLTGPGGTGKTRLALHVAAQLRDDFADGVFLVELAPIADPALIASAIAQTLGVREVGGRPLLETLKGALRDRQTLLVLDNFEHLLAGASLVSELLAHCPRLKVLATSRAVLHLHEEQEWVVPPLAVPPVAPSFRSATSPSGSSALLQYAAVELFVRRARNIQPKFAVTPENARTVADICRRLDGLPLAIELAAARLKLFPPHALLARLKDPLQFLTGGSRDVSARQRTLRDTIAWSYDLLNEAEQRLFRRVSVFVGGCTLESAAAICNVGADGEAWVLDGMNSLVDNSLLQQEPEREGQPRFRMLETIREYGLERLVESGEAEALQRQHAEFFLALAERAQPALRGPEHVVWLDRLKGEHDNLRAALAWSLERGAAELGLRLATGVSWSWTIRGHYAEGRDRLTALLALPGAARRTAVRAEALNAASGLAQHEGDHDAARALIEESLAIWQELGDPAMILNRTDDLALAARFQGDYQTARSLYQECLARRQGSGQTGQEGYISFLLYSLGYVAYLEGDLSTARSLLEQSLPLAREALKTHYTDFTGWILTHLAEVADDQGDPGTASAYLEEAMTLWREMGWKLAIAWSLHKQGRIAQHRGDWGAAGSCFAESLTLWEELGNRGQIAGCLEGLAAAAAGKGHPERACRLFGAAEALREAGRWSLAPVYRAEYEQQVAAVRGALGDEAFAEAWAEGRAMPFEQAVRYAL